MSSTFNTPPAPATQPKTRKRWIKPAAIGGSAFIIGTLIGAAGQPAPETITKEVEVPVEKIVTETVTEEVEVEVTPASCVEALDYADEGFGIASEQMGLMLNVLEGVQAFDVAAIEQASADMEPLTAQMNDLSVVYNAAKADCRASQ